jgi:hypothetical protein
MHDQSFPEAIDRCRGLRGRGLTGSATKADQLACIGTVHETRKGLVGDKTSTLVSCMDTLPSSPIVSWRGVCYVASNNQQG